MIKIGRKPDTNEPVYFPTPEQIGFVPHVGIFGIPGIGKTVTLKKIIAELYDLYREERGLTADMIVEKYSEYRKSRLYVDQEDHVSQQMLSEIMKPARAKGCTVMYTSTSVGDYLSTEHSSLASAIKDMTGCYIILYLSRWDLSIVSQALSLSAGETAFLSERKNGGLIVTKSEHIPFVTERRT